MNSISSRHDQQGAVLLVALVMLLVLTLFAVSSMRSSTLEGRITANRAHDAQQQNAADAALREAEYRYYKPGNLINKLESSPTNCVIKNTLQAKGLGQPCLLSISSDNLLSFVERPSSLTANFLTSASTNSLLWMPYNGTGEAQSDAAIHDKQNISWNSIRAVSGNNVEYGMEMEGKGTYYYLNNAKATDSRTNTTVYLQSTNANIYMGLNN
jgi:type IV pilus assembly protein PilX